MKTASRILRALLCLVAGTIALNACTLKPGHEVGKSIEGAYAVYFHFELFGHLNLIDGKYSFTPLDSVKIPEDIDQLSFIEPSEGEYKIQYYGSITSSTLLESVGDNDILLQIEFPVNADDKGSRRVSDIIFHIRNDKKNQALYLSQIGGIIQEWSASKSWD